jgi:AcrR family transcriptional regulator
MKHQRAIDEAEKNERRGQILHTAAGLFETATFDQVSMLDVARVSGIAKGTVYLYFSTKEELFLALIDQAFDDWFTDLQQRLATLPAGEVPVRIAVFASKLTNSLQGHRLLLRLLPILHTVLEHNIPDPAARAFKQRLRDQLLRTGEQIEASFSFLRPGQGAALLLDAYAALIGFQSMAEPADGIRRILQEPGMEALVVDGSAALRRLVARLLTGIYVEKMGGLNEKR